MEIKAYVEVTKLAAQYEPVKIGIGVKDDVQPKDGETKAETIHRGTQALYNVVSDEVSLLISQALDELRA